MEIVAPGTNGYHATSHISVSLCSGKSQETDQIWGKRQGAKEHLVKPTNVQELAAKIAAIG